MHPISSTDPLLPITRGLREFERTHHPRAAAAGSYRLRIEDLAMPLDECLAIILPGAAAKNVQRIANHFPFAAGWVWNSITARMIVRIRTPPTALAEQRESPADRLRARPVRHARGQTAARCGHRHSHETTVAEVGSECFAARRTLHETGVALIRRYPAGAHADLCCRHALPVLARRTALRISARGGAQGETPAPPES